MFTRHIGAREFPKWGVQIDFVAAYIIPLDLWYILPAPVTTRLHGHISLHLHRKGWIEGRLCTRFTHLAEGICLAGRTRANRAWLHWRPRP